MDINAIIYSIFGVGAEQVYKAVDAFGYDLGAVTRAELLDQWRGLLPCERRMYGSFAGFVAACMEENGGQLLTVDTFVQRFGHIGRLSPVA